MKITNLEEWKKIRDELTSIFGICSCQRKVKSIVLNLHSIYLKCQDRDYDFTGAEWLLIALLDKHSDAIMHGVNCEFPIINQQAKLWEFILRVVDNEFLEDN